MTYSNFVSTPIRTLTFENDISLLIYGKYLRKKHPSSILISIMFQWHLMRSLKLISILKYFHLFLFKTQVMTCTTNIF